MSVAPLPSPAFVLRRRTAAERRRAWLHVLRFALQGVRAHRLRSFLSGLGVLIGVTGIVALGGAVEGVERAFHRWTRFLGPDVFYVEREPLEVEDWAKIAGRPPVRLEEGRYLAERLRSARAVVPRYALELTPTQPVRLELGKKTLDEGTLYGSSERWALLNGAQVAEGRFLSAVDVALGRKVVVVGAELGDLLREAGLGVGSEVTLDGQPLQVVGRMAPRGRGLYGSLDRYAVLPFGAFEELLGPRNLNLGVVARDPAHLQEAMDETLRVMRTYRQRLPGQEDDFSLQSFADAQKLYRKLSAGVIAAVTALALLALLVSGGGIMNVMLVAAAERRQEVGVLMALGARPNAILAGFLAEAALLAGLGALGGAALGSGIALLVGAVSPLQATVVPMHLVIAVLYGAGVGVAFGFLPAYRASRVPPAKCLRGN